MEKWQLKQVLSLPLEAKIIRSLDRIKQWYEYYDGEVYISFSGGKDSTVLAHLVRSIYPKVPLVFCNTGLEYPEIIEFVRIQNGVEWIKPELTFRQVIDKHGYPITTKKQAHFIAQIQRNPDCKISRRLITGIMQDTGEKTFFKLAEKWKPLINCDFKISDKCCDEMKKKPFKYYEKSTKKKPFIGIVGGESLDRDKNYLKNGCNAFEKENPASTPLAFWTEQNILTYLKINKINIAKIYGDIIKSENGLLKTTGVSRTGCMFCGFGVHLEQSPNRFQQMKSTHPKLWSYCMFNIGMAVPLDFIGVDFGQQISIEDIIKINNF